MSHAAYDGSQRIRRLLLDAQAAFPYSAPSAKQSTLSWSQTSPAAEAIALLPEAERQRILKYLFPRDAALSLGSNLLKHFAITQTCGVPWKDSVVRQERTIQNGKPFFEPGGIEFNISHHGSAAAVVFSPHQGVKVGIDLTMVDTDRTLQSIQRNGFENWVRVFEEIFSEYEIERILQAKPKSNPPSHSEIVQGMRMFYSYWALKEGYLKMNGEALLAKWIKNLEFRDVVPPAPSESADATRWTPGETTRPTTFRHELRLSQLQLELTALGQHYIVATSVEDHSPSSLPAFEVVEFARDILPVASA